MGEVESHTCMSKPKVMPSLTPVPFPGGEPNELITLNEPLIGSVMVSLKVRVQVTVPTVERSGTSCQLYVT